ncbi:MAG: phage tail sheath family protein [Anaerolineae bacterium]|nr:phage tail sheath family protein [Anaerolineae bacterium]MCB9107678.1 phage tail sheath family protein [Anaerolineales bacterium]
MPEYLAPGVYVEEVDRGPKPIEGVGTALPVFIGFTEKAEYSRMINRERVIEEVVFKPQLVTNWGQYQETFGSFVEGAYLPHAVYGYFMNGGTRCYVLSIKTIPKASAKLLGSDGKSELLNVQAKQAGFEGLKLRVRVESPELKKGSTTNSSSTASTNAGESSGEATPANNSASKAADNGTDSSFTLIIERKDRHDDWKPLETVKDVTLVQELDKRSNEQQVKIAYKNKKPPKFVELFLPEQKDLPAKPWPKDGQQQSLQIDKQVLLPAKFDEYQGDALERTGLLGLAAIDNVTMVCAPDLMTPMPGEAEPDPKLIQSVQQLMIDHCELMGDRVAILDSPPHKNPMEIKEWRQDDVAYDSSYAALYYPWVEIMDPVKNEPMLMPPSGHIAGVWARNDQTRGVHKAPANETISGAIGLAYDVTHGEQQELNPLGINCIRKFPAMGIRVWGARTLTSDPAWRYINVRRLFNFVEKSIERGTQWVVFEPNDMMLWARVRRDTTAFLTTVWSSGALFGASPSDAFYVKCDEELNPVQIRDQGQLIIEIGMAPVKPAEFVIFRISQWSPEYE